METVVKHLEKDEGISAFAFGVGQKIDEMVKTRIEDVLKEKERLELTVFVFRQFLASHGTGRVDASEVLELYDSTFGIKTQ
jgi:hypothetical protein